MKLVSFFILSLIFCQSCSSEKQQKTDRPENPIDSFESATPHGQELKSIELSDTDKIKLARANGKTAQTISFDSLNVIIDSDTSGLVIYNFWNLDCTSCKSTIKILKKLQHEVFEDEHFKVVYINTESLYPDMINSYIRETGMIDEVFTVAMDTVSNWSTKFQIGWEGQLPAVLLVNNDDGTRLFYQKEFTLEELQAVILPLTF